MSSSSSEVPASSSLRIPYPRRFIPSCGRHPQEWSAIGVFAADMSLWMGMSEECLAPFQRNQQNFFTPVCDQRWKMGPLLCPRDKTTVRAVETWLFSTTKESKGNMVGLKGHGFSFLISCHSMTTTSKPKYNSRAEGEGSEVVFIHPLATATPWWEVISWNSCLSWSIFHLDCSVPSKDRGSFADEWGWKDPFYTGRVQHLF